MTRLIFKVLLVLVSFYTSLSSSNAYAQVYDDYAFIGEYKEIGMSYDHHAPITITPGHTRFVIKSFGTRTYGTVSKFEVWFYSVLPNKNGNQLDLGDFCNSTDPNVDYYCPVHSGLEFAVRVYSTDGDGSVVGIRGPSTGYAVYRPSDPSDYIVYPGCTVNYSFIDNDIDLLTGQIVLMRKNKTPTSIADRLYEFPVPEGPVVQGQIPVTAAMLKGESEAELWFILDEHSIGIDELVGCGSPPLPTNVTVSGTLWDSTGLPCTADKNSNKYSATDINGGITVSLSRSGTPLGSSNWVSSSSTYSVPNIPYSTDTTTICTNNFLPSGLPNFKYVLKCVGGTNISNATPQTDRCGTFNMTTTSPNTVSLGFDLVSAGWYSVQDGDVYAGDTSSVFSNKSISSLVPNSAQILGGFTPYLINDGIGFAGNDINVKDADNNNALSSSDTYAKHMEPSSAWPQYLDYAPPSGAIELTTCNATMFNNLNSSNVYRVSSTCLNSALASVTSYTVNQTQRLVVIYVTGTSDLVFSKEFKSNTNRSRILFVSEVPVVIDRSIGSVSPTPSASAHIQAAIVSKGDILFEGTADSSTDPDTTVIMEGPIVTGGDTIVTNIDSQRDRGTQNGYPGVYVKFNPDYLIYLTKQSRDSATENFSGLTEVKITWEEIE